MSFSSNEAGKLSKQMGSMSYRIRESNCLTVIVCDCEFPIRRNFR